MLNGSRELATPLLGWLVIYGLALATINPGQRTKFEISIFTHYKDVKSDTNGVVLG